MIREEDKIQDLTHERFSRVQRALDGRNVGLKDSDFGAASPPKPTITGPTAASMRRSGISFATDTEEATYVEQEHQHIVAQNNLRHAQDTLLLQQLDKGVLPERFIKQGVHTDDPRHVSVVLSKFGIGDTRGVCLGKWYVLFFSVACRALCNQHVFVCLWALIASFA
jgi:hypothetical protein